MNREVFSLAWTESTVYATGASGSGLRGPKRLSYSNWEVGFVDLITFVVFDLTVCRIAYCNWEMLSAKLLAFSNLEKHTAI